MILGIDAFNIRSGGGVTHLVELLRAADPSEYNFQRVIVWGNSAVLSAIENRSWLVKVNDSLLERGLLHRVFWQRFRLRRLASQAGCDVLFVPGGSDASGFKPLVTMSQNLLPFEGRELRRYGLSLFTIKLLVLRLTQSLSFRRAHGVIFLTEYARNAVLKVTNKLDGEITVIPHGVNDRFRVEPSFRSVPLYFPENRPCKVLYVSVIDMYKHQWHVAEAIWQLRLEGLPVVLDLVGPPARGMGRFIEALRCLDPEGAYITYNGAVPYESLDAIYAAADIGVFASSCENMPNILLEGMAAGLPIACSNMGPMPEILGKAGVYFDPEDASSIADALRHLILSPNLRIQLAQAAFDSSHAFSWKRCADATFKFIEKVAQGTVRDV